MGKVCILHPVIIKSKLFFGDKLCCTLQHCEIERFGLFPFLVRVFRKVVCFVCRDFHPCLGACRPSYWPFDHFLHTWVLSQERRHDRPVHLQHSAHCGCRAAVLSSDLHYHLWVTKSSQQLLLVTLSNLHKLLSACELLSEELLDKMND